jgi:hypothetical protein
MNCSNQPQTTVYHGKVIPESAKSGQIRLKATYKQTFYPTMGHAMCHYDALKTHIMRLSLVITIDYSSQELSIYYTTMNMFDSTTGSSFTASLI